MSYYDRVSVRPKPADEPAVNRVIEPTTTPTPGALPGATRARPARGDDDPDGAGSGHPFGDLLRAQRERLHTLRGRHGRSGCLLESQDGRSRRCDVDRGAHAAGRRRPRPSSAAAAAAPAPPRRTAFRHRTTISVQFGVDNQFSGKMIKAATGATTGGAPINLNETTFDDVYGRIGMLKIGAGYRTSPRTEGGLQLRLVRQRCADTAPPMSAPLAANGRSRSMSNFTSYKYWGIEGGNRWYFARTRFTPYRRLSRRHQSAPGHPRHVRRCADRGHARTRRAGRQVLREVLGAQPRSDRAACSSAWVRSR